MILVGYVFFDAFLHNPRAEAAPNGSHTAMEPFQFNTRKVEISWIMRESYGPHREESDEAPDEPGWPFLRSIVYRGTLDLKYLLIPSHAAEFFTLFLDHIRESWLELVEKAKLHLAEIVSPSLHIDLFLVFYRTLRY